MTARFLLRVAPGGSGDERTSLLFLRESHGFETRYGDGFELVCEPGDIALSLGDHGLVVGKLFSRIDNRAVSDLAPDICAEIVQTRGQWLLKNCWGGYVALLRDPGTTEFFLLRDPSGLIACYHAAEACGTVYFTNEPELLSLTSFGRGRVDWTRLSTHLRSSDFRGADTCFSGVSELLPGCRLRAAAPEDQEPAWKPWDHIVPDWRFERESPSELLRRTIDNCVGAWARTYDHIVMGISGGLDSSIVLSSLKTAGASPLLYTLATRAAEGDERDFAQSVADHFGYALSASHYAMAEINPGKSHVAHLARPVGNYFVQAVEATVRKQMNLIEGNGAAAIFSGGGGDNVFCFAASATPAADRLLAEGLGPGFLTTLRDIHSVTGASVPQILTKAISRACRRDHGHRWKENSHLIAAERSASETLAFAHPWLDCPRTAPPGKALHIALLLRFHNHIERHRRSDLPATIMPLLSQPIIELCLSIPSWSWFEGGINRSVARAAFADRLPTATVRRTVKGRPDSFALEIYDARRDALRDMLGEGLLRQQRVIDWHGVETVLNNTAPSHVERLRLLEFGNAEAWARHWTQ